jgi:hypothetical protein
VLFWYGTVKCITPFDFLRKVVTEQISEFVQSQTGEVRGKETGETFNWHKAVLKWVAIRTKSGITIVFSVNRLGDAL